MEHREVTSKKQLTAENAESAEKRFTTEGHPPASPAGEADGGQADLHGEDFFQHHEEHEGHEGKA
jgi:hypothetical protein